MPQQILDVVLRFAGDPPGVPSRKSVRANDRVADERLPSGLGARSVLRRRAVSLLPLAKAGSFNVTAVEENPRSVADGIESVKKNDIRKCCFVESRSQQYLKKLSRDTRFDTVILDPPRDGCPEWASGFSVEDCGHAESSTCPATRSAGKMTSSS